MVGLLWEIAAIALPAAFALAADPLSSLVDTMFIGRIGSVELAAVGVSISLFNLVSKVFNIPLLTITTSFVAEDKASSLESSFSEEKQASVAKGMTSFSLANYAKEELADEDPPQQPRVQLPAVSSSLALGLILGLAEAALLAGGSSQVLKLMGVPPHSDMFVPAKQYLLLRSIASPAIVVSLAIQGSFRGFKDTKTPLYATVLGNVVHIALDPVLMFTLRLKVYGAAAATVISDYLILLVLLYKLNQSVVLFPLRLRWSFFGRFFRSGGLLLLRTIGTLLTMTFATSLAARLGANPMAAHQICVQIWLAASLLSDSLALAGQAIVAEGLANAEYDKVKLAAYRVLQIGFGFGVLVCLLLFLVSQWLLRMFTRDTEVLEIVNIVLPFVIATQPINSLAFVVDGLYFGGSDFAFSAYSTICIGAASLVPLFLGSLWWGLPGIWIGLSFFMCLRLVTGLLRLGTASGPWRFLKGDYKMVLPV
ncbi:protein DETOXIFICATION 44, chloroplastic [Selaginella moellendorffii]|uniref:protein DETOXIFICATION 44, chloroplastic n=1 Tax=Selaginella moellendorffii TaxID=88036 RepID=UPI000D1CAD69|nr:protein DETOXIFICATION 44, chloroplastic [Selaginella moellendorffii]|eukprot:XP_024527314.1 protein DETOXIFICATION 44, chloroplastic [Selaginella moellendorffii]